ncbi:helix-turn-helix transcriptional regulator [Arthrobacter sp. fls2-241-R2A-172]|uniref:helix-turn-helix transcriptional regulator n=1 Tax=Arthrobacter sp. fls2-241-R2A-172 TaxID=3040325 RepID=UPI00254C3E7D|nr:helix-turn-helix transcriptional regulator [Arthrobacter sp. fls2-241-R2A-172]
MVHRETGSRFETEADEAVEQIGPGRSLRIISSPGGGRSAALNSIVNRLERTGHTAFVVRALRTHRNIPYSAIARLDLRAEPGHPVLRLADDLTAQLTVKPRTLLAIDDIHHVDPYSLAVIEDALRRSNCPLITTAPDDLELTSDHLAVTSTRSETLISLPAAAVVPTRKVRLPPPQYELTPRETEVCALARHCTNLEIANRLHLSVRTVENHISNALRKTGASSRLDLFDLGQGRR